MKGFISRFPFGGVRVDEALRIFLLSVRLPAEANAGEVLLTAFATRWHEANHTVVAFDRNLSIQLVLAIMQLNVCLFCIYQPPCISIWPNRTHTDDHAYLVHLFFSSHQDALNPSGSFGFAFANQAITVDDFVQAFRVKDPNKLVRDDLLGALYISIQKGKLCQALSTSELHMERDIYQRTHLIISQTFPLLGG